MSTAYLNQCPFLNKIVIRSSTGVALKAREVLISGQMPSYEERLLQMGEILKASVTNNFYGEGTGAK